MNRIFTLMVVMFLFLLVPLGCAQSENSTSSENKEILDKLFKTVDVLCKNEANFANLVMTGRQTGVPMSVYFEKVSGGISLEAKEELKNIIARAYATPRFSSEGNRREAIEDFTNEIYLECYVTRREEVIATFKSSK